ncbi:hypothetical protein J2792_002788 [Novosphingobium capsulatum]|uniref:DUF3768 domain-containing protein n=1 Tax=Novosphingobium capsulatum TaxID=13688 RepID=A0ABU1MNH8_9SPHN|nr:DUF3768 domain-containing protein [Novosphingobium capsulatum]MDR6511905.1 hypothetical protein [Novosphingobium capsulatum]
MDHAPDHDRVAAIARANDLARCGGDPDACIVITRNCLAAIGGLGGEAEGAGDSLALRRELFAAFRDCSFAADCPERDFAEIHFRGLRVWLKIDCYDRDLVWGSPDPADPAVTRRVVTILLPEDY